MKQNEESPPRDSQFCNCILQQLKHLFYSPLFVVTKDSCNKSHVLDLDLGFYHNIKVKEKNVFFRAQAKKALMRHIDVNSVVWTLNNGKLANQIPR